MPARLGAEEAAASPRSSLDAAVVAAYGLILPKAMLAAPRLGCLNVHASLLPRWRGAAPIERAHPRRRQRDRRHHHADGRRARYRPDRCSPSRADRPAHHRRRALRRASPSAARALLLEALDGLAAGRLAPRPQPAEGATYAQEARARRRAARLAPARRPSSSARCARSTLRPAPGSSANGERIKVLAAELAPGRRARARHRARRPRSPSPAARARCGRSCCSAPAARALDDGARSCAALPLPPGTVLPCPATS